MSDPSTIAERLAEYVSHKRVRAGEITEILPASRAIFVKLADESEQVVHLTAEQFTRGGRTPEIGDRYVVYEDGYSSISPRGAFLGGYARVGDSPEMPQPATEA
jgi:hypothetical protein